MLRIRKNVSLPDKRVGPCKFGGKWVRLAARMKKGYSVLVKSRGQAYACVQALGKLYGKEAGAVRAEKKKFGVWRVK